MFESIVVCDGCGKTAPNAGYRPTWKRYRLLAEVYITPSICRGGSVDDLLWLDPLPPQLEAKDYCGECCSRHVPQITLTKGQK